MIRRFALSLLLLLVPAALLAVDADLIVPVTGTLPGAMNSSWQGELSIHNAGKAAAQLDLTLYRSAGDNLVKRVTVPARSTVSFGNVASDLFSLTSGTGALAIDVAGEAAGTIAVSSRVLNHTAGGVYGQDVPALAANDALRSGATGVIVGPATVADSRFNFGIVTLNATTIEWRLLRADGAVDATLTKEYEAGRHEQYNQGVQTLFVGATPRDGDTIHARVLSGNAFVYGSIVANGTGDPTFVPGIRVLEQFNLSLVGVDVDENGTIDIRDENGDGTLDAPIVLYAAFLPNYFRIEARPGDGTTVHYRIDEAPRDTELIDANGTILSYPALQYKGQTSRIVVHAWDDFGSADFIIPVIIR